MVAIAEDLALKQPSARFSVGGMGGDGEGCMGGGARSLVPCGEQGQGIRKGPGDGVTSMKWRGSRVDCVIAFLRRHKKGKIFAEVRSVISMQNSAAPDKNPVPLRERASLARGPVKAGSARGLILRYEGLLCRIR